MSEVIFEFRKNAISHVIALFICNISLTTIFFVINIILSSMLSNFDLNYIYIMFKQFTITYCLPTTFFIVFGCVVGRIKSLKIMILAIMVTAFLTSPMAVEIYNDLENPILKSILYNFDIIQNNTYPMGSFFVGIHYLYKWIKIIGFITLAILLFYKLYFFKQNKVIIAILGVIFVLSEIYYFQPDSKSWDYERFLCENSYYYENEKYALEE
ncbi:MAG: hypothetical protein IJY81_07635, partial [Lachnospiraceae bacterium]|nr:hypothetical protein [Lachnospiraceae bacterium]